MLSCTPMQFIFIYIRTHTHANAGLACTTKYRLVLQKCENKVKKCKKKATENVKRESKIWDMLSCTPMQGFLYRQIQVKNKNKKIKGKNEKM